MSCHYERCERPSAEVVSFTVVVQIDKDESGEDDISDMGENLMLPQADWKLAHLPKQ